MNVVLAKQKLQRACFSSAQHQWRKCISKVYTIRHYSQDLPSNTTEAEIKSAQEYCTNLIRTHDRSTYTLIPFIPPAALQTHLAVRALHIALTQIPSQTSNAAIAAVRIQFWRDAITSALNFTPKKEPISLLLSCAAKSLTSISSGTTHLSKSFLQRLVTAHANRLHHPPIPDLAALETTAEQTHATLFYLTLQALPPPSLAVDHIASHIGKAQGLIAALRSIPLLAFPQPTNPRHHSNPTEAPSNLTPPGPQTQGTVPLPLSTMATASLREEDLFRHGAAAPGLRDAVFAVATRAHDHLATARDMAAAVLAGRGESHAFEHAAERAAASENGAPALGESETGPAADAAALRRAFGVLMPALPAQMWLDALQRVDFDVFSPRVASGVTDWKLPWKAYWAFKGRRL